MAQDLPEPPKTSLVVKRSSAEGVYRDENGEDWTAFVSAEGLNYDIAFIDASTLTVEKYQGSELSSFGAMGIRDDGAVLTFGQAGSNHTRFEPNLKGLFVQAKSAFIRKEVAGR